MYLLLAGNSAMLVFSLAWQKYMASSLVSVHSVIVFAVKISLVATQMHSDAVKLEKIKVGMMRICGFELKVVIHWNLSVWCLGRVH